jgi:TRAP-type uncharacterized transport system substrate-binding protein
MTLEDLALLSRRGRLRVAALIFVLLVAAVWASAHFLEPAPPRHIVLASGLKDGLLHEYAQRYIEILARAGVTVEERVTNGPGDNVRLLLDPKSGVDVAFMQGGFASVPGADRLMMLASLYYVPMWIFYNGPDTLNLVADLRYRRIAIGVKGSGARAFAEPVLAINGLNSSNVTMLPMSNIAALRTLQSGDIGAAIFVDGPQSQAYS